MTAWAAAPLLVAGLLGGWMAQAREPAPPAIVTQMTIRRSSVIRIPTRRADPDAGQSAWRERKGPKCVAMDRVAAAAVVAEDSVDLILRGGDRVRVRFEEECADLDYYHGFYIRPGADGRICADRDSVRARSGGECRIERFRALQPGGGRPRGGSLVDRIRRRLGH